MVLRTHLNNREKGTDILTRLGKWGIYPAFSSKSPKTKNKKRHKERKWAVQIMKNNNKNGIPTTVWTASHRKRSFSKMLGYKHSWKYSPGNPAVYELAARYMAKRAANTPGRYFSPIDENSWRPVHYDKDRYIAYLIKEGYKPTDFGVNNWSKLAFPDITKPIPESRKARLLLRELQKFSQWTQLRYYRHMAKSIKAENPKVHVNLGIFTPWQLYYNYYACLPVLAFHNLDKYVTQMEWDFYDWMYNGDTLTGYDFAMVQAGNQFLSDLVRLPVQITLDPAFGKRHGARDRGFYRLFILTQLLTVDNITGITIFHYHIPTAFGFFTMDNPLMTWIGKAVHEARKAYPIVHSIKKRHHILIVCDRPLWKGVGTKYAKNKKPIRYGQSWYYRCYQPIARTGRDASFAVPSMLKSINKSQYDVIAISAPHISNPELKSLLEWSQENGHKLLYLSGAAKYDKLGFARKNNPLTTSSNAQRMPNSVKTLSSVLEKAIPRRVFEPMNKITSKNVRINVRANGKGDIIVVAFNYAKKPEKFAIKLFSNHTSFKKILGTSVGTFLYHPGSNNKQTILKGKIYPRNAAVIYLPADG